MKTYNVVKYWSERDNPCSKTIDKLTDIHLDYLQRQTFGCQNILDFGPGYGRMFPAYKFAKKVIGIDVTTQYKTQLQFAANKGKFNFELICKKDNFSNLEFPDKHFDVVVTSEVLFHQTPNTIEPIMRELNRISRKVVVISYMNIREKYDFVGKYTPDQRYCFNYNYYEICKKNNWNIRCEEWCKNQIMFVYSDYFSFDCNGKKIKFLFDNDDYYMSRIIKNKNNFYEIKYLEYLKDKILNTESHIIEVGAYLGNHTIYFSEIIGCKMLYCYEPTPYSFSIMKDNININIKDGKGHILTYPMAIYDRTGYVNLIKTNPDNPGANQYDYGDKIYCSTLDEMHYNKINNLDFLKIDVENSEMRVLVGGAKLINKHKPIIMIEVGKDNILEMTKWINKNRYKRIASECFNKNTWLLKRDKI
jgi:FkbM family methyltransferase